MRHRRFTILPPAHKMLIAGSSATVIIRPHDVPARRRPAGGRRSKAMPPLRFISWQVILAMAFHFPDSTGWTHHQAKIDFTSFTADHRSTPRPGRLMRRAAARPSSPSPYSGTRRAGISYRCLASGIQCFRHGYSMNAVSKPIASTSGRALGPSSAADDIIGQPRRDKPPKTSVKALLPCRPQLPPLLITYDIIPLANTSQPTALARSASIYTDHH